LPSSPHCPPIIIRESWLMRPPAANHTFFGGKLQVSEHVPRGHPVRPTSRPISRVDANPGKKPRRRIGSNPSDKRLSTAEVIIGLKHQGHKEPRRFHKAMQYRLGPLCSVMRTQPLITAMSQQDVLRGFFVDLGALRVSKTTVHVSWVDGPKTSSASSVRISFAVLSSDGSLLPRVSILRCYGSRMTFPKFFRSWM